MHALPRLIRAVLMLLCMGAAVAPTVAAAGARLPAYDDPSLSSTSSATLAALADARSAESRADWESAADAALRALGALAAQAPAELRVDVAAYAVECLAHAERATDARSALAQVRASSADSLPADDPARLRLDLAEVRLLALENQPDRSAELAQRIEPALASTFGANSEQALLNQVRLGTAEFRLGRVGPSLLRLSELAPALQTALPAGHPVRLAALHALQAAQSYAGANGDAMDTVSEEFSEAVGAYGFDDRRAVDAREDIARLLGHLGREEDALSAAAQIYLWRVERLGADNTQTQSAEFMLGHLYDSLGRYGAARVVLWHTLESARRSGGEDSFRYLEALDNLASATDSDGDHDAAVEMLARLERTTSAKFGESSIYTQASQIDLGIALLHAGQVERACKGLEDVRERIVAARPDDVFQRELAADGLGRCLLVRGGPDDAERASSLLAGAWRAVSEREGDTSWRALQSLGALASARLALGDTDGARGLLETFVERAEQARAQAAPGSLTREAAFGRWVQEEEENAGYRTLAWLYARDGRLDDALRIGELSRDRTLRDRFADLRWHDAALSPRHRARLDDLAASIQRLDERIAVAHGLVARVKLESERLDRVAERGVLERELRDRYGHAARAPSPPTLVQLQRSLAPRTALASIGRAGSRWWALVVTPGGPARYVALDREPSLGVAARAWARHLRGEPVRVWRFADGRLAADFVRPDGALPRHLDPDSLASRLGEAIVAPLAAAAPQARHFVIVGDDDLTGVPFEALPVDGKLAVERFDFTYAPSMTSFSEGERGNSRGGQRGSQGGIQRGSQDWPLDLLAVASPGGSRPPAAVAGTALRGAPMPQGSEVDTGAGIPFADEEARGVARFFPSRRERLMLGGTATKQALLEMSRRGELARFRYVHVAAHAAVDVEHPERATVLLDAGPDPDDRQLTATEIAGMRMRSELVVLSACDTGVGLYQHGQGLLGLTFGILGAGNRAAVVSLWPVADDATARFMQRFYRRLRAGAWPAQALAQAKLDSLHAENLADREVRNWGAFVVYGRP
jgi:CHAT domain-containing protein